jgi:hypothetical protein
METLGSLVDKLTIVQLKAYHTTDVKKQKSLLNQDAQLQEEITKYMKDVLYGVIPPDKLVCDPNKVHDGTSSVSIPQGDLASTISFLAIVNGDIWHQQEKIYNFSKLPVDEKDEAIHQIAILNLQRNDCIHQIDKLFKEMVV